MTWLTTLRDNPFSPALSLLAVRPSPRTPESGQGKAAPSKQPAQEGTSSSTGAANDREERKMQQYMRQIEESQAKEARKKKMQELKQEREASDPCKCGRARSKKLPRPLATGGPRCNQCLPLLPQRGPPELRDAPVFRPTEEEFADPMQYIRSIQEEFFAFGICRIQPPASWQPPTSFHWRKAQEEEEESKAAAAGNGEAHQGAAGEKAEAEGGGRLGAEGKGEGEEAAPEVQRQGSAAQGEEYQPITDDNDFFARLQTVKARRAAPGQPHCTPFTCSFVPRYAKYTIAQLRELDAALREEVWPELGGALPAAEDVEAWFWEGLASEAEARILYSSDLEGTAFPDAGTYGEHAWSLQKLANHDRSLLRFVDYSIPGVNCPMLYFGMLFSMFCWHVEDNYMYSVSYLHEGAPKTWYGVSPQDASEFDRVFNARGFPSEVAADPHLLLKKSSMLPPSLLVEDGVPVSRAVQQPGQFVVTLPQAYHAGFSHGANTAEAVNFMLTDWLPYARCSMARYRALQREPVLDLEQILVKASLSELASHSAEIGREAAALVTAELRLRGELRKGGCAERGMEHKDKLFALGRGPPCFVCGHVCHLSFAQLGEDRSHGTSRTARQEACLVHAAELLQGGGEDEGRLTLFTRYEDSWLQEKLVQQGGAAKPSATLQQPAEVPGFHTVAGFAPRPQPGADKHKKQKVRR